MTAGLIQLLARVEVDWCALSLLSCIPTALAWTRSPHQPGTTSDANFYPLIANIGMQILGSLTLIIPTISNARLVGHAWFWAWVLAGTSIVCAIVAIPLCLSATTEWSAAVLESLVE